MASLATTELRMQGDPRRPQDLHPYVPPTKPEDQPGDLRLITAMMCGLMSMLTKVPWFSWAGVALCLVYFAHVRSRDFDLKTSISALFFCSTGLAGSYITHLRPTKA